MGGGREGGGWCVVREGRRVGGLRGGIAEKARGGWGHGGAEARGTSTKYYSTASHGPQHLPTLKPNLQHPQTQRPKPNSPPHLSTKTPPP